MATRILFCAPADSPMATSGAVFDKRCDRCDSPVMVSRSGQRLLASATEDDPVEIRCLLCYITDPNTHSEPIELTAPIEEVVAEAATSRPNLHRNRN